MPLDEQSIKAALIQAWRREGVISRRSVIATELRLGTNSRRVDLAVLGKEFVGVEIKSDFDDVHRLSGQLDIYTKCFDRVIVVTTRRHVAACDRIAPESVSIYIIDDDLHIEAYRENTERCVGCAYTMLRVMNTSQLRDFIGLRNEKVSRRDMLQMALGEPLHRIREHLIAEFEKKYLETNIQFWNGVAKKKIRRHHICLLSRFAERRIACISRKRKQNNDQLAWLKGAESVFGCAA